MTDTPEEPQSLTPATTRTTAPSAPPQVVPPVRDAPHVIAARVLEADLDGRLPATQLLYNQAALLDALFSKLMQESVTLRHDSRGGAYNYVRDDHINMALRAQKQCRQTLDCMALRLPSAAPQNKKAEQTESPS